MHAREVETGGGIIHVATFRQVFDALKNVKKKISNNIYIKNKITIQIIFMLDANCWM